MTGVLHYRGFLQLFSHQLSNLKQGKHHIWGKEMTPALLSRIYLPCQFCFTRSFEMIVAPSCMEKLSNMCRNAKRILHVSQSETLWSDASGVTWGSSFQPRVWRACTDVDFSTRLRLWISFSHSASDVMESWNPGFNIFALQTSGKGPLSEVLVPDQWIIHAKFVIMSSCTGINYSPSLSGFNSRSLSTFQPDPFSMSVKPWSLPGV